MNSESSHLSTQPPRSRVKSTLQLIVAIAVLSVSFVAAAPTPTADAAEVYGKLVGWGGHNGGGFDTRDGGYERWEWTPSQQRIEASTAHGFVAIDEYAKATARVHSAFIAAEPMTHVNLQANWSGLLRTKASEGSGAKASYQVHVRLYEVNPSTPPFGLPTQVGSDIMFLSLDSGTHQKSGQTTIRESVDRKIDLGTRLTVGKSYRIELGLTCESWTSAVGDYPECEFQHTPKAGHNDTGYGVYLDRWWFDSETCNGQAATVVIANGDLPTDGRDVILGTDGDDEINALGGDDVICGGGGDDLIRAGDGDDIVFGQAGNDKLWGAKGVDTMYGGDGDDTIHGNRGADLLYGEAGADRIFGYSEADVIHGGEGDDKLHGNRGNDEIYGEAGNDSIFGYADDDALYGGDGNDLIGGNFGNDAIYGGVGDDTLYGSDGVDRVNGEDGNDIVEGNSGNDILDGGTGEDELDGGINNDSCFGGTGSDTATRCEDLVSIP